MNLLAGALQRLQAIYLSLTRLPDAISQSIDVFFTPGTLSKLIDPAEPDNADVLIEVESMFAEGSLSNRFSPAVEKRFLRATSEGRFALFYRVAWIGILTYMSFAAIDFLIIPDIAWLAATLTLGVGTPISVAVLLVIRTFRLRSPALASVTVVTMMSTTLILVAATRSPHASAAAEAFSLIVVASNVGFAMPFRLASMITVVASLAITVVVCLHPTLDLESQVFAIVLNTSMSFLSLVGNHRIEASMRRSFLHSLREGLRANSLATANLELRDLVAADGLTGVANRRHFDAALARIWEKDDERPVSLVMIDIDHFKSLNDRFGHQAGDDCLRIVAKTLVDAAPAQGSTLARYGGEEFALLIDGADVVAASQAAETLRRSIAALAVRLGEESETLSITVSLGCACAIPGPHGSAFDLVAAADAALYSAKRSGRNCVKVAEAGALYDIASRAGLPAADASAPSDEFRLPALAQPIRAA